MKTSIHSAFWAANELILKELRAELQRVNREMSVTEEIKKKSFYEKKASRLKKEIYKRLNP